MEFLSDSGYIKDLGVCDLDKPTLEKLYQWARVCYLIPFYRLSHFMVIIYLVLILFLISTISPLNVHVHE